MIEPVKAFAHRNPVRVAGFIAASIALFLPLLTDAVSVEAATAWVLSVLGLSEVAQRVENGKTSAALATDPDGDDDEL